MIHEAEGIISSIGPIKSGQTKAGVEWKKQIVRLSVENEQFPQMISLQCTKKVIPFIEKLRPGDRVKASFSIECRMFQDNDYCDIKCFNLTKA